MYSLFHRIDSQHNKYHFERSLSIALVLVLISSFLTPLISSPAYAIDVPGLLTPSDNATITATGYNGSVAMPPLALPEFSWTPVRDAKRYRLQFSQDIAFVNKYEYTTPLSKFNPTGAGIFNDGLWYWRVRVDSPVAGEYSGVQSFIRQWASPDNAPVLLAPGINQTLEFFNQSVFSWQPVFGAGSYKIQIATASDFTNIVYNQTTIATTHQPLQKFTNGAYYWRVIPIDPANHEGTYSQTGSFNMGYNRVPTLIEPANNSTPTFTPTFRWTAVTGAQLYRLQYSTDPTFNTAITSIDTNNTTYTPNNTLPNDVNYYWRVRVHSGSSISDWSSIWNFRKQWYIQPVLLTPVNLYQFTRFPFFSWTPVPGASSYKIEVDRDQDFVGLLLSATTTNPFYTPDTYSGDLGVRYWRVIPYDGNGKPGKASNVSSYISSQDFSSPNQVFPLYYYTPNNFPEPDENVEMQPHEVLTSTLPVFTWQRLTDPISGANLGKAYRIEVSADPLFGSTVWIAETENLNAAPTTTNPFNPAADIDYFWRVRALDDLNGNQTGEWSQAWKARIDLSIGVTPTVGTSPQLIRPVQSFESVETTPLFEWFPMQGADSYEVQISRNTAFTDLVDSVTVPYPVYAPINSLGQRSLGRDGFGTYYWRVRSLSAGVPQGTWSSTWRFQIAAQSERIVGSRTPGSVANQLLIATDPDDTGGNTYELTSLYAAQDTNYWYFGFMTKTGADMRYGLYLDVDHKDNSGATIGLPNYPVTAIPSHLPEFAILISKTGNSFLADQTSIYAWGGSNWNVPQLLSSVGGSLSYDPATGYLELRVPNTAIGMGPETGSYALSLFSLPATSGAPQDSVPADPEVPGSNLLSRFASVTERMNTVFPRSNTGGDPASYSSAPPFFWEYPSGSSGTAPWAGALMRVYLDPQYTTQVAEFQLTSTGAYYAPGFHAWPSDFQGDNTYYWRIRPRYPGSIYGSWSQGSRFERRGFIPQNLEESVTNATPTFSWDLVEGVKSYDLQVDNDPNFGSPVVSTNTPQNSFTPNGTLANSLYYWRVRVLREGATNEWSPAKTFTLALPHPNGLTPDDPQEKSVVERAPTFCWNPLIATSTNDTPVMAAYRYRVQVSKGDPTFSTIYESVDTEQTCWTPSRGYDDGKYYWHVAMIDGQGKLGEFSTTAQFTKQYRITTLISPVDGPVYETPTFVWSQLYGAASYKLEIALNELFSPLYDSAVTQNIRYTPTRIYEPNKTYYWRVAIVDKDGRVGPFNDSIIILDPGGGGGKWKLYLPTIKK